MKIPPTRNHRQLAQWINTQRLGYEGNPVTASVERAYTNTDRKLAGTRLRIPGRGRRGLRLEIYTTAQGPARVRTLVYSHDSSETYRRHEEARTWVAHHLRSLQ